MFKAKTEVYSRTTEKSKPGVFPLGKGTLMM
jgi:hypothetical protein